MDHQLMAKENLDQLGFSEEAVVQGAREYDKSKEIAGFTAGKHISHKSKWWWESKNSGQQPSNRSEEWFGYNLIFVAAHLQYYLLFMMGFAMKL